MHNQKANLLEKILSIENLFYMNKKSAKVKVLYKPLDFLQIKLAVPKIKIYLNLSEILMA